MRVSLSILVAVGACLLGFGLAAATDLISVDTEVDRREITIGDRVQYTVTVTADTAILVDSLSVGSSLGAFEIKDYVPRTEEVRGQYRIMTEAWEITTFTTGVYEIPSLEIKYRDAGGRQRSIATDPLSIEVKSLLTGEEASDIKPLKAQRRFAPDTPWWLILVAAAVLGAAVVFWVFYRRARRPIELGEEADTRLPWEIALSELNQLEAEELIAKGEYKLFYLKLSDIYRRYLERRYGIGAMELTTWEVMVEFERLGLPDNEGREIREFLDGFR
jgi:hypothetical protein